MADVEEEDDHERFCHDLLIKLKKTSEGLLAGHSAQGVWGTYGGLRRVCMDTEAILCHRLRKGITKVQSDGSYWPFVQGLKWISPNLAPVIDKLKRLNQSQRARGVEAGRAWLRDSVQDHSLMTQLDILLSNQDHLHGFYHNDAFLCQHEYVEAMRICFKAIELNKPALLTDISPHLVWTTDHQSLRSSSLPVNKAPVISGQPVVSGQSLPGQEARPPDMGNKHSHLHVTYSAQLSSSNLSLTVDPSLGASSLLHNQKTLSDPYFVSSLDSPRVLENLRRDPLTDAILNSRLSTTFQTSRQPVVSPNNPSLTCLQNIQQPTVSPADVLPHTDQNDNDQNVSISAPTHPPPAIALPTTELCEDDLDSSRSKNSSMTSEGDSRLDNTLALPGSDSTVRASASQSSFEDISAEAENLHKSSTWPSGGDDCAKPTESDLVVSVPCDPAQVLVSEVVSQRWTTPERESDQPPHASDENRTDIQLRDKPITEVAGVESENQFALKRGSHVSLGVDAAEALNIDQVAVSSTVNPADIKTHDIYDQTDSPSATQTSTDLQTLPSTSPASKRATSVDSRDIRISISPDTPSLLRDRSNFQTIRDRENFQTRMQKSYGQKEQVFSFSSDNLRLHQSASIDDSHDVIPWSRGVRSQIVSVKSDPALNMSDPLISPVDRFSHRDRHSDLPSPRPFSPGRPYADPDLYRESDTMSPVPSPITKTLAGPKKSSGNIYIPQPFPQESREEASATSASGNMTSNSSNGKHHTLPPPSSAASRKYGHKRWGSDTSAVLVDRSHQSSAAPSMAASGKLGASKIVDNQQGEMSQSSRQQRYRALGAYSGSYQGTLTRPTEGQSLMSYLTSQDFNTCANLEKENAHFHISEALIAAFESMRWNRMMRKQETGRSNSTSSSASSDEEIQELRQRIRIRKREKMMEKGRPFPSLSDGMTDTATTSQTASSPVSSQHEFSSLSGSSDSEGEDGEGKELDLSMSSNVQQGSLTALRSSGLTLSMASLYSDAELQRSNQQIERNSSHDESTNPGSAESIAISLLKKFSEKHLPKASELKWLVSERDAPQRLLPLPSSIPVSPDDVENSDMANRTRLRGNLEWAPPRAQIIFSIHPSEKRTTVMSRQNYRCAGCGMKVDPAFIKRHRYCEYLGKYFCQCCHTGETSIIPGRVIERWDFSRHPVSTFSYSLLEKMWTEPLFHVDTINPALYKRVRGLESIREGRKQLTHLHSLLAVCKRDPKLMKEMQRLPGHWISNDDAYSMEDFTQVKSGAMLAHIKSFIALAVSHVQSCQLCQGLGFICGMCLHPQVIFPFQLDSVVNCPVCQSCYHKECFIPDKCPKCIRLEARRKMLQEPLSPDSPDSGENDEHMDADGSLAAGTSPPPTIGSAENSR